MKKLNVLFTSVGRRVVLIDLFKKALNELSVYGNVLCVDAGENSAARYIADIHLTVPKLNDPSYINELLSICKKYAIDILIPLIDTELFYLATTKSSFEEIGVTVLLSSKDDIEMCGDKKLTHEFFLKNNFDTPAVLDHDVALETTSQKFPLFIKPANGSSSVNAFKVNNINELRFFLKYVPNPILQEFVIGQEYTVDVLVDFFGKVRCVVPRLRIETRAGEVSKGITVKNPILINAAKMLVEKMHKPMGCITVQCFLTNDQKIKFIEINPRFGGGFPLSCAAGANFPLWILQMYLKQQPEIQIDSWVDSIKMLRYDDAIFLRGMDVI